MGNQTTSTLSACITTIDIKPQLRAAGVCLVSLFCRAMLRGHTADRGQENDRLSNSSAIKKAPDNSLGPFLPGAFSLVDIAVSR